MNLLCTWMVEMFITQGKTKEEFRQTIRENRRFLDPGLIYQLLQNYGKIQEFIEFASIIGDYEKVILFYINQGEIDEALNKLTWFSSFSEDPEILGKLTQIFSENCHLFFKKNPKESISLLQQRFKDVKMNVIVQAIMSTTDKDNDDMFYNDDKLNSEKAKKAENSKEILKYLKSLVEKPKIEEENNIHNLYIYYLSRNKANQEAILDYLKRPLKNEKSDFSYYQKKKEVLFQLDYAKKLFKDNPQITLEMVERPQLPFPQPMDGSDGLFAAINKTAQKLWPGSITVLGLSPASGDNEFLRRLGVITYGLGPEMDPLETNTAHSANEFIKEEDLERQLEFIAGIVFDFVYGKDLLPLPGTQPADNAGNTDLSHILTKGETYDETRN